MKIRSSQTLTFPERGLTTAVRCYSSALSNSNISFSPATSFGQVAVASAPPLELTLRRDPPRFMETGGEGRVPQRWPLSTPNTEHAVHFSLFSPGRTRNGRNGCKFHTGSLLRSFRRTGTYCRSSLRCPCDEFLGCHGMKPPVFSNL